MLDIKDLRDNIDQVQSSLIERGYSLDIKKFKGLDAERRVLQVNVENLQSSRKKLSEEFGKLKASGKKVDDLKDKIDHLNKELKKQSIELDKILESLNTLLLDMPNVPDISCPVGASESDNVVIKKVWSSR